jgi:hypothetical protein
MKLRRFPIAFVVVACVWPSLAAADSFKIDRTIRREPAFAAKPQYCLLVFGPEAKRRVWLVVAGEAFYADRNDNGDLTEPGKRVYSVGNSRILGFIDPNTFSMWLPVPENERIYDVGDIFDAATRTWYNIRVRRSGTLNSAKFEILVDTSGRFRQIGQVSHFGATPQSAPVLHFNGPLTLGFLNSQLIRGQTGMEISAWIGTNPPDGAHGAPAYLIRDGAIPSYFSPVAWFEFPGHTPADRPIQQSLILARRNGLVRFSGWLQIPDEAGGGNARVTLSLPNWKWGRVRPTTIEMPIIERIKRPRS